MVVYCPSKARTPVRIRYPAPKAEIGRTCGFSAGWRIPLLAPQIKTPADCSAGCLVSRKEHLPSTSRRDERRHRLMRFATAYASSHRS